VEYSCEENKIQSETYVCENGCSDGACLQEQENCTETDGGRYDYYTKGTITTQQGSFTDFCVSPTMLTENYCDYSYYPPYQGRADSYTCPFGCSEGACLKEHEQNNCTDSDDGKNYYQKGTATANGQNLTDQCNEDGTLMEKYCYGNEIEAETYQCPYGCQDGACIQQPPAQSYFTEGFESYSVSQAPSSPWQTLANAGTVTEQMVHSGVKSLLLSGGPNAAQTEVVNLGDSFLDNLSYEVYVRIDSSGSGCFVGFFEQVGGQAPEINCVYFNGYDGKLYFYSADQNHPINVLLAENFLLGIWNKVHVDMDYQALKADVYLNDVLIGDAVPMSPKNAVYSGSSFTLRKVGMLHFLGSGIYFDDFSINQSG
jgi:hypothetical protein